MFTHALIESRWFPGHFVPLQVLAFFVAVLMSGGLGFHALLESKGGRAVALATIFVGLVPLMIGAILSTSSNRLLPAALWVSGISPISSPVYAAATLLSVSELPPDLARAAPIAFYFWLTISSVVTTGLIVRLFIVREGIAVRASGES